ncbi:MAG: nucleotidyltransferase family protein [Kiritimatiellia bacterium]
MRSSLTSTVSLDVLARELSSGRSIRVCAGSASMSPSVQTGDVLTVEPVDRAALRRGDIVIIGEKHQWLAHRLLTLRQTPAGTRAVTAGDAANRVDNSVNADRLIGKVTQVRRHDSPEPMKPARLPCGVDQALLLASFPHAEPLESPWDISFGVPWNSFREKALSNGLAELIYYFNSDILKADAVSGGSLISSEAKAIENRYFGTLSRNILFLDRARHIGRVLKGIDFVLLKGAYLAEHIYDSPALRPFSDIDILVRPEKVKATHRKLTEAGYSPPGNPPEPSKESDLLKSTAYRAAGPGPALHVHWDLANSILPKYTAGRIDVDEFWQSAVPTAHPWLAPDTEHLIIHLCEHALRHSYDRLILLRDIAEVILKPGGRITWNRLSRLAQRYRLDRAVYYALDLLSARTGIAVPGEVLDALRPAPVSGPERLFAKALRDGVRYPELCNLLYFDTAGSAGEKWSFVKKVLFPPKSLLARAYGVKPAEISAAVYTRRIARGLYHALTALRLIKHGAH